MATTNVNTGGSIDLLQIAEFIDNLVQRRKTQRELKNVTYGPQGPEGVSPVRMADPRYAEAIKAMFQSRGVEAGTGATQDATRTAKETSEFIGKKLGGTRMSPSGLDALANFEAINPMWYRAHTERQLGEGKLGLDAAALEQQERGTLPQWEQLAQGRDALTLDDKIRSGQLAVSQKQAGTEARAVNLKNAIDQARVGIESRSVDNQGQANLWQHEYQQAVARTALINARTNGRQVANEYDIAHAKLALEGELGRRNAATAEQELPLKSRQLDIQQEQGRTANDIERLKAFADVSQYGAMPGGPGEVFGSSVTGSKWGPGFEGLGKYYSGVAERKRKALEELSSGNTSPSGQPLTLLEQTYKSPELLRTWQKYYDENAPLKSVPGYMGIPTTGRPASKVPPQPTTSQDISDLLTSTGEEALRIQQSIRGPGDMSLKGVQTRSKQIERLRVLRERLRGVKPAASKLEIDLSVIDDVEAIIDSVLPK